MEVQVFHVHCSEVSCSTELNSKWMAKPLRTAIIEPFLLEYSKTQGHKKVTSSHVLCVEMAGSEVDASQSISKLLGMGGLRAEPVEVVLTLVATFNIYYGEYMVTSTIDSAKWLSKPVTSALIEPFLKSVQKAGSPISLGVTDFEAEVNGESVDVSQPAKKIISACACAASEPINLVLTQRAPGSPEPATSTRFSFLRLPKRMSSGQKVNIQVRCGNSAAATQLSASRLALPLRGALVEPFLTWLNSRHDDDPTTIADIESIVIDGTNYAALTEKASTYLKVEKHDAPYDVLLKLSADREYSLNVPVTSATGADDSPKVKFASMRPRHRVGVGNAAKGPMVTVRGASYASMKVVLSKNAMENQTLVSAVVEPFIAAYNKQAGDRPKLPPISKVEEVLLNGEPIDPTRNAASFMQSDTDADIQLVYKANEITMSPIEGSSVAKGEFTPAGLVDDYDDVDFESLRI